MNRSSNTVPLVAFAATLLLAALGVGGTIAIYHQRERAQMAAVEARVLEEEARQVAEVARANNIAPPPVPMNEEPEEQEPEIVLVKPDPDLDRHVEKEAKAYGESKSTKKLPPALVVPAAMLSEKELAAKIDAILDAKLAEQQIPVSPQATDAEFLRRCYLDIAGVIPTASKARAFLTNTDPDKRAKLVDELLADSQYGQNFAHYWHDLLVKRDVDNNKLIKTHDVFLKWLGHQFNANKPWDETVRTMLTGRGDQALAGETFFVLANAEEGQPAPSKIVGTAAALFLGNQLMCAECHVHPNVGAWTQDDIWGLAAFFRKVKAERETQNKKMTNALATIVDATPAAKRPMKGLPNRGAPAPEGSIAIPDPRNMGQYIGTAKAHLLEGEAAGKDNANRSYIAEWFTKPENPFFARAAVNRVWSQFFARGLINPLDDIRPDSVATHAEALELLAADFVASKFDQKRLIRVLCLTQAYQRSSRTMAGNKDDEEQYSHVAMKVLPPRNLFRSYGVATNSVHVPEDATYDGKPAKADLGGAGLAFFDAREYDESPGEYTYGVPQMLRLINSKLPPACDSVGRSVAKMPKDKAIEQLYLTALSRFPTADEAKRMADFATKQGGDAKGYSAAMWVLLNSAEFVNNH